MFVLFQEPDLKYDLLLIHSPEDNEVAKLVKTQLRQAKVKVTTIDKVTSEEELDLYSAMLGSARYT